MSAFFLALSAPWEAIKLVTGSLSLLAFALLIGIYAYRQKLGERESLIRAAPEAQRGRLVLEAIRTFGLDPEGLSKKHQYELAIKHIEAKESAYHRNYRIVITIILILGIISLYALYNEHDSKHMSSTAPLITKKTSAIILSADSVDIKHKKTDIKGTVINESGDELPDALVFIAGMDEHLITDKNGGFSMPLNDSIKSIRLHVSKKGYNTEDRYVDLPSNNLHIKLLKK